MHFNEILFSVILFTLFDPGFLFIHFEITVGFFAAKTTKIFHKANFSFTNAIYDKHHTVQKSTKEVLRTHSNVKQ